MKRQTWINKVLLSIFFFAAAAVIALPNPVEARDEYLVWRQRRAEFEAFMRKHPKASTELQQNPRLAYDAKWLKKHREVARFLDRRPEVREAIVYRPRLIYGPEYRGRYERRQYDRFHRPDPHWRWAHR